MTADDAAGENAAATDDAADGRRVGPLRAGGLVARTGIRRAIRRAVAHPRRTALLAGLLAAGWPTSSSAR